MSFIKAVRAAKRKGSRIGQKATQLVRVEDERRADEKRIDDLTHSHVFDPEKLTWLRLATHQAGVLVDSKWGASGAAARKHAKILLRQVLEQEPSYVPALVALRTVRYNKKMRADLLERARLATNATSADECNAFYDGATMTPFDMYSLSVCLFHGCGLPRAPREALKWCKKSAELGCCYAMVNLGLCYENGQVLKRDAAKAFEWYTKAAADNHADGKTSLAYCYAHGIGVARDERRAAELEAEVREMIRERKLERLGPEFAVQVAQYAWANYTQKETAALEETRVVNEAHVRPPTDGLPRQAALGYASVEASVDADAKIVGLTPTTELEITRDKTRVVVHPKSVENAGADADADADADTDADADADADDAKAKKKSAKKAKKSSKSSQSSKSSSKSSSRQYATAADAAAAAQAGKHVSTAHGECDGALGHSTANIDDVSMAATHASAVTNKTTKSNKSTMKREKISKNEQLYTFYGKSTKDAKAAFQAPTVKKGVTKPRTLRQIRDDEERLKEQQAELEREKAEAMRAAGNEPSPTPPPPPAVVVVDDDDDHIGVVDDAEHAPSQPTPHGHDVDDDDDDDVDDDVDKEPELRSDDIESDVEIDSAEERDEEDEDDDDSSGGVGGEKSAATTTPAVRAPTSFDIVVDAPTEIANNINNNNNNNNNNDDAENKLRGLSVPSLGGSSRRLGDALSLGDQLDAQSRFGVDELGERQLSRVGSMVKKYERISIAASASQMRDSMRPGQHDELAGGLLQLQQQLGEREAHVEERSRRATSAPQLDAGGQAPPPHQLADGEKNNDKKSKKKRAEKQRRRSSGASDGGLTAVPSIVCHDVVDFDEDEVLIDHQGNSKLAGAGGFACHADTGEQKGSGIWVVPQRKRTGGDGGHGVSGLGASGGADPAPANATDSPSGSGIFEQQKRQFDAEHTHGGRGAGAGAGSREGSGIFAASMRVKSAAERTGNSAVDQLSGCKSEQIRVRRIVVEF